jgi:hypothetical protein
MKTTQVSLAMGTAAAIAALGLAACDRHSDIPPASVSPSAQLIGVTPAPPTGDPPGTTPVAKDGNELTKHEESSKMPLEGQPNSYSSVASGNSQKAGGKDPQQQPSGEGRK